MVIHNYMETLVAQYLDEALEKNPVEAARIQQDPSMRAQVMVHALNKIPPFYVTGKVGEVYGYSNAALAQNKTDIMVEIVKAIEVVVKNSYN